MEGYRIISNTENMAHFIFSGMKLGGKINKLVFHTTGRKTMKLPVAMRFKVTKIYTGPRKDRTNLWK